MPPIRALMILNQKLINMDKNQVFHHIIEQGLVPLYFHPDKDVSVHVMKALYNAGIRIVEYTNRGTHALENFSHLRRIADKELPGLKLGAGTIKSKKNATGFINEGADFIVCPGMIEEVADVVNNNDLLWIPGCMTVTEIIRAENLNAKLVKLFPGSLLGPSYVMAVKEIFPDLLFIPTGGVELEMENLQAWFKAGVCAVGMGSKLISKYILENKDYNEITKLTTIALGFIKDIKNNG